MLGSEECLNALNKLRAPKFKNYAFYFLQPVPLDLYPDYLTVCPNPMDFSTIERKLQNNEYARPEEFAKDVRVMFSNGIEYNKNAKERAFVAEAARKLMRKFENIWPAVMSGLKAKTPVHLSSQVVEECEGVLARLERLRCANAFSEQVDTKQYPDYPLRVPHPMDLSTLGLKLARGDFSHVDEFARALRRIPANCLRYSAQNIKSNTAIRSEAVQFLVAIEKELAKLSVQPYALIPVWKACIDAVNTTIKQTIGKVDPFLYPVEVYYPNNAPPPGYREKVSKPMDFGTLVNLLVEGGINSLAEFQEMVQLIFNNCRAFWASNPDRGLANDILASAKVVETACLKHLKKVANSTPASAHTAAHAHAHSSASTSPGPTATGGQGKKGKAKASSSSSPSTTSSSSSSKATSSGSFGDGAKGAKAQESRPAKSRQQLPKNYKAIKAGLDKLLKALESHKLPNGVLTAKPFMHPVDVSHFPDYLRIIKEPMDMSTVRRRLHKDRYGNIGKFRRDVRLIFSNALKYNTGDRGRDVCLMANMLLAFFEDKFEELAETLGMDIEVLNAAADDLDSEGLADEHPQPPLQVSPPPHPPLHHRPPSPSVPPAVSLAVKQEQLASMPPQPEVSEYPSPVQVAPATESAVLQSPEEEDVIMADTNDPPAPQSTHQHLQSPQPSLPTTQPAPINRQKPPPAENSKAKPSAPARFKLKFSRNDASRAVEQPQAEPQPQPQQMQQRQQQQQHQEQASPPQKKPSPTTTSKTSTSKQRSKPSTSLPPPRSVPSPPHPATRQPKAAKETTSSPQPTIALAPSPVSASKAPSGLPSPIAVAVPTPMAPSPHTTPTQPSAAAKTSAPSADSASSGLKDSSPQPPPKQATTPKSRPKTPTAKGGKPQGGKGGGRSGKGKNGKGGKGGKTSPGAAGGDMEAHWSVEGLKMLQRLMRHELVAPSKDPGRLYMFCKPVVDVFPDLREDYLRAIRNPMDLGTVEHKVRNSAEPDAVESGRGFKRCADFVEAVLRVFINAIEYNHGKATDEYVFPQELCLASLHLGKYFRYLVLESPQLMRAIRSELDGSCTITVMTELTDSTAKPTWHSSAFDDDARKQARLERKEVCFSVPIKETKKDCEKLLKSLKQTNDRKYSWHFEEPINLAENPTYVRLIEKPTSRKQCEEHLKLDQYITMGQMMDEVLLIYGNAITFNSIAARQGNKLSKSIVLAAEYMQKRLEEKLTSIVMDASERILRARMYQEIDRFKIHGRNQLVAKEREDQQRQLRAERDHQRAMVWEKELQMTEDELARQEALQRTGFAISSDVVQRAERLNIGVGADLRRVVQQRESHLQGAQARLALARTRHAHAADVVWDLCKKDEPRGAQPSNGDQAEDDDEGMQVDTTIGAHRPSGGELLPERHQPVRIPLGLLGTPTATTTRRTRPAKRKLTNRNRVAHPLFALGDDGSDDGDQTEGGDPGSAKALACGTGPTAPPATAHPSKKERKGAADVAKGEKEEQEAQERGISRPVAWEHHDDGSCSCTVDKWRVVVSVRPLELPESIAGTRDGAEGPILVEATFMVRPAENNENGSASAGNGSLASATAAAVAPAPTANGKERSATTGASRRKRKANEISSGPGDNDSAEQPASARPRLGIPSSEATMELRMERAKSAVSWHPAEALALTASVRTPTMDAPRGRLDDLTVGNLPEALAEWTLRDAAGTATYDEAALIMLPAPTEMQTLRRVRDDAHYILEVLDPDMDPGFAFEDTIGAWVCAESVQADMPTSVWTVLAAPSSLAFSLNGKPIPHGALTA